MRPPQPFPWHEGGKERNSVFSRAHVALQQPVHSVGRCISATISLSALPLPFRELKGRMRRADSRMRSSTSIVRGFTSRTPAAFATSIPTCSRKNLFEISRTAPGF